MSCIELYLIEKVYPAKFFSIHCVNTSGLKLNFEKGISIQCFRPRPPQVSTVTLNVLTVTDENHKRCIFPILPDYVPRSYNITVGKGLGANAQPSLRGDHSNHYISRHVQSSEADESYKNGTFLLLHSQNQKQMPLFSTFSYIFEVHLTDEFNDYPLRLNAQSTAITGYTGITIVSREG